MDRHFEHFELNLVAAPPHITNYPVEVGPSPGKGNGVFATRNIPRGSVVCWYAGLVVADSASGPLVSGKQGYNQHLGTEFNDIFVAGFPEMLHDGACAQLINDYATEYIESDLRYLKHINVDINVVELAGGEISVAFIAKKRIKKGSELFYCYGQGDWQSRRLRSATSDLEEDYALKLMTIVLDKAHDYDNESKLVAYHMYKQALQKLGIDGYRARHAIGSCLSHLTMQSN